MTPIRLLLVGGVAIAGMRLGLAHAATLAAFNPCDGVQPWRVHEITVHLDGTRTERDFLLTCFVLPDGSVVLRGGE